MRKRSFKPGADKLLLLGLLLAPAPILAGELDGASLQPTLLEVSVNGQAMDEPLLLLQDSEGGLYANAAVLRQWRMSLPSAASVTIEGEAWYRIDNLPEIRTTLSVADQSLAIEAQPELFDAQSASLGAADDFEMTQSGTGGFANYDLFAEYFDGTFNLNGAIELGAFTSLGVGSSSFIAHAREGRERIVRLDTSWTIDRPGSISSIRIGDGVSSAGPGASPLRFGGIQYARNFAVRPGYLTMPLPVLQGSAAVPSVVDIYVNNALQGSRDVAPGPFEVSNVPVQSGGGSVRLVIRDLLGRQVISEQSYYASSALLRRGLHDYSFEIGFEREGFGTRSADYGTMIASTAHRYGLTDRVTIEGHAQASARRQLVGVGVNFALFDLGMIGGSATMSRSARGTGAFVAASVERRSTGLSFGLRSEYATRGYAFLGMTDDNRAPRFSTQAFADMPLLGGSIGINLLHRDQRVGEDESLVGLFANMRVMDSANVQLFARRAVAGDRQTVFGAHFSLGLGGRRSMSASVEHRSGSFSHNISYQENAPAGLGGGYRASTSMQDGRRTIESVYTYNAAPASFGAHVSRAGGSTGVRLSTSGAVGLIGGSAFASRSLGAAFAEVQVGNHRGVRVYADNQLVGVTDGTGTVVVPSLRAFDRNIIRIDESDLPLDAQIADNEILVRPFARSGAVVRFAVRQERGALISVRLEDGTPLPAGAAVRVEGSAELHVAASGGEVYIPSLSGTAQIEASWPGRRCTFSASVPAGDDPQPRIEGIVCRSTPVFAER